MFQVCFLFGTDAYVYSIYVDECMLKQKGYTLMCKILIKFLYPKRYTISPKQHTSFSSGIEIEPLFSLFYLSISLHKQFTIMRSHVWEG